LESNAWLVYLQVRSYVFVPTQAAALAALAVFFSPTALAAAVAGGAPPAAYAAGGAVTASSFQEAWPAAARLQLGGLVLPALLGRFTEGRLRAQFAHEAWCGAQRKMV